MFRDTLYVNNEGELVIGGVRASALAEQFGTPLYCMDEAYLRKVCRGYAESLRQKYPNFLVCFASKAFSTQAIYKIVEEEGLGADVVSAGELYTAATAGFPLDKVYLHGNNKLPYELDMALRMGVHAIVADGEDDFATIVAACERTGVRAKVLLRVNPGVEAHTHHFVQTATPDSKFGVSIADGTALALAQRIASTECVEFSGLHSHIGSQIFEVRPFQLTVEKLTDFIASLSAVGITVKELNLGGGYGISYTKDDEPLAPHAYTEAVVDTLVDCVERKGIAKPRLIFEPGRSIVGEAGITLYRVGAIKEIKGLKKYVAVDGGMFENPRYALYQARYSALLAQRANEPAAEKVTIAGKCCESGDVLIEDLMLPAVNRGDLLAVFSTGAYNYSMASNYNRNLIPPVVLVNEGKAEYIVRPQTLDDLIARDVIPTRFNKR